MVASNQQLQSAQDKTALQRRQYLASPQGEFPVDLSGRKLGRELTIFTDADSTYAQALHAAMNSGNRVFAADSINFGNYRDLDTTPGTAYVARTINFGCGPQFADDNRQRHASPSSNALAPLQGGPSQSRPVKTNSYTCRRHYETFESWNTHIRDSKHHRCPIKECPSAEWKFASNDAFVAHWKVEHNPQSGVVERQPLKSAMKTVTWESTEVWESLEVVTSRVTEVTSDDEEDEDDGDEDDGDEDDDEYSSSEYYDDSEDDDD